MPKQAFFQKIIFRFPIYPYLCPVIHKLLADRHNGEDVELTFYLRYLELRKLISPAR